MRYLVIFHYSRMSMKPDDINKFCSVISKLADIYGQRITNKIMTYYWSILEKFTLAEILFACRNHVYGRHGNFMPKPFDIAKKITGLRRQLVTEGIAK